MPGLLQNHYCKIFAIARSMHGPSVDDEWKKAARNEDLGSMPAAHGAGTVLTRSWQDARVLAGFHALVTVHTALRLLETSRQVKFVPVARQPARSPVLDKDYGRRPHRCLQSGRITSRRP
jgi:hypothetical protein